MHSQDGDRLRAQRPRDGDGGRRARARVLASARRDRRGADGVPVAADARLDRAAARRYCRAGPCDGARPVHRRVRGDARRPTAAAPAWRAARSTCGQTTSASRDSSLVQPVRRRARRGSPRATTRRCRTASSRAGSRAPSPVAARSRSALPRISITSCARTSAGSTSCSISTPATPASAADQLARRAGAPRADVEDARLAGRRQQPVGARDVAHVGEVAPRVGIAGHQPDRVVARLEPGRDLARERGQGVDRRLPGPGVVEGARAHDAEAVRVGVETRQQVAGRLADRVRVLRPQRSRLVHRQRRGPPVDLAGRDRHEHGLGRLEPHRLEHVEVDRLVVGERRRRDRPRSGRRARARRGGRRPPAPRPRSPPVSRPRRADPRRRRPVRRRSATARRRRPRPRRHAVAR